MLIPVFRNEWDTEGCRVESGNDTYTLCVCDHLTNFALLMDYQGLLDDVDQRPFHYITLVGCILSIISLSICVVVFSCYRSPTAGSADMLISYLFLSPSPLLSETPSIVPHSSPRPSAFCLSIGYVLSDSEALALPKCRTFIMPWSPLNENAFC
ncbi:hypothetical protein AVEN_72701-1 [Araneus ventricosus]|uniref:GAIN-B domain-containing protein n=1 Tax=Araneus ventricosus TaxID=182803 RepID=A0A4Y2RAS9_ARAVE|nr:hypothetical protein AVEN_72701-1 [Araneus ventricosus]